MFHVLLETGLLARGSVLVHGISKKLAEFSGIIFHFILVSLINGQSMLMVDRWSSVKYRKITRVRSTVNQVFVFHSDNYAIDVGNYRCGVVYWTL